jgi:hypothetical protein
MPAALDALQNGFNVLLTTHGEGFSLVHPGGSVAFTAIRRQRFRNFSDANTVVAELILHCKRSVFGDVKPTRGWEVVKTLAAAVPAATWQAEGYFAGGDVLDPFGASLLPAITSSGFGPETPVLQLLCPNDLPATVEDGDSVIIRDANGMLFTGAYVGSGDGTGDWVGYYFHVFETIVALARDHRWRLAEIQPGEADGWLELILESEVK